MASYSRPIDYTRVMDEELANDCTIASSWLYAAHSMQSSELCHCIVVVSVNESVSTEGLSQDTLLHN